MREDHVAVEDHRHDEHRSREGEQREDRLRFSFRYLLVYLKNEKKRETTLHLPCPLAHVLFVLSKEGLHL